MKKSQIITQIILNCGLAQSLIEANKMFVQTFVDHYLSWNLQKWDTVVPHEIAEAYLQNPAISQDGLSVRLLIKDLETFVRRNGSRSSTSLRALFSRNPFFQ